MKKLFNKKILALLMVAVLSAAMFTACKKDPASSDVTSQPENEQTESSENKPEGISLGEELYVTGMGGYTGMYMEDGSNGIVSDVLMLMVTNNGEKTVQYAEISMPAGEEEAKFTLSTLPAGATVVLLEQSHMIYDGETEYADPVAQRVAFFSEEPSLMEDTFRLQVLDGVMNVTNISDADIEGEIVIYYKNKSAGIYYGGITYRSRIQGGLAAGEIRQMTGGHISQSGTEVMFVTVG